MISELMNKQFLVIDETDIANIKSNDQSKGSPNHSRSNSLAIPTSPPSLIPLSTSPGSPSRFSGHRRGSSLSKGQLEIRKVYEKISTSPIFNVKDKVLEKNQKAIQLSNDESLLALYFNDWLEVMEEQSDSHHHHSHSKPLVKKKDHFHVKFTMYDMDDYPFYFPLNLLDDGRLHDDFVKFGVTFFIPSIKEKERTFMFLEDGLVHLLERSDFELSSEGVSHYKSESFVIRENSDKCKILKKLKKICKVIQDFNIDKTFHMNKKGGSFFFCRKIAKIFSEEGNLKSSLSDNIKKLFKLWKERADKKMEDEEHLDDFYHDPFYCKNEYVPMDDLSKLMKKATQTDAEKIKSSAIHPSAYEIIFEKILISSSMMATGNKDTFPLFEFHLPKKGHFSFETYSQFNEFLYEHFGNEEGLERMKKHHHMDYLYLKILDRKLWCCKIATGLFDPLISKPYLFNIGARKPFFSIPISLKEYFGNAEAIQIDYTQLKESKKGQTVKVLCLDGGGMRGLCIIEQLIAMEQKTGKKINELFDMVSGTSTGGIIAFFIEAGYSMEEVKAKYMLMGRDIFNIKSKFANMKKAFNFIRGKSWYETKIIEKYFRQESGRMDLYSATNTRPFVFVCGTIKPEKVKEPGSIVSSKFVEQFPYIFRTYPDPFISTKELSDKLLDPYLDFLPKNEYDDVFYAGTRTGRGVKVVDSLRATTSAPIFFDPVCIGNDHFTDGGIVANNPSAIALNEVMRMYMGHNNFLFVSLGTGKKRRKVFDSESIDLSSSTSSKKGSSFSSSSMDNITERSFIENLIITASDLKLLIDLVISSERIHAQMLTTVKLLNERDCNANISYYRFDPDDLGQYDLDCILPEVIEKYEKTTREYILSQPDFDVVCKRLLDP